MNDNTQPVTEDNDLPKEDLTVVDQPVAHEVQSDMESEADGYYDEEDSGDGEVDLSFLDQAKTE